MDPAGPQPPAELGGYRLGALLGEGGMGAVYRATDSAGAEVVLKLIHPRFAGHGSAGARFAREASITAALSHPGIVRVLASDIEGARPFIAMEYVEGRTLGAIIRDDGPLGLRRATGLIEQLLSALVHALRPAFFIDERESCLVGVTAASFSVTLETNAQDEIESVRFQSPGPLNARMQECLRRRMIDESSWSHIPGPGRIEIRAISLVCF